MQCWIPEIYCAQIFIAQKNAHCQVIAHTILQRFPIALQNKQIPHPARHGQVQELHTTSSFQPLFNNMLSFFKAALQQDATSKKRKLEGQAPLSEWDCPDPDRARHGWVWWRMGTRTCWRCWCHSPWDHRCSKFDWFGLHRLALSILKPYKPRTYFFNNNSHSFEIRGLCIPNQLFQNIQDHMKCTTIMRGDFLLTTKKWPEVEVGKFCALGHQWKKCTCSHVTVSRRTFHVHM